VLRNDGGGSPAGGAGPRGALLCVALLLSGAAALVFETLWFRATSVVFGSSVWASSLVLAGFMTGLALGNAVALRLGPRLRRPLVVYAALEAVVAVSGFGLVLLLPDLAGWAAPLFRSVGERAWLINPLRLGLAFSLLVLPSTALGLTLPVVVAALARWDRSFGPVLGRLYGWNTLGAVAGALAAEWALIGWFGVRGTALVAAGCSLAAGSLALVLSFRAGGGDTRGGGRTAPAPRTPLGSVAGLCGAAAFLAGGLLLAAEVIWFRFLHLFVHGGSPAFAAMLATVLAAIGTGALIAGWWTRHRPDADRLAPAVALLAGAVSIVVYASFRFALRPYGDRYVTDLGDILWLTAALTVPTSLASGMLFPLTGLALQRAVRREVRTAGLLALCNTAGAALGPLIAGFVLLPRLGMERSFFLLALGYVPVAALLFLGTRRTDPPGRRRAVWVAGAALAVGAVLFPFGLMRSSYIELPVARAARGKPVEVVALREGRSETLIYLRYDFLGEPLSYQLVTDGYNMAGSGFTARRYMKQFVYLPLALSPEPSSALLISYGTGATARALTDIAGLERIDVVDTSREVLEMSDIIFDDPAEHPLHDPRVHVHIEDGRHFLQTTRRSYDLITGEPPPPKMAGVVNLYTREFFRLVRGRLGPAGRASYWLAAQNLTDADARSIIRAFCDVFDDCSLWQGFRLNWILVGSNDAPPLRDESTFRRQWLDPRVGPELAALGFELPEQLGATFLAGPGQLAELTRESAPLTDDRPKRLSDFRAGASRGFEVFESWMDPSLTARRFAASEWVRRNWPETLRRETLAYFPYQGMINEIYRWPPRRRDPGRVMTQLHATLTRTSLRTLVLWQLGLGSDESAVFRRLIAQGRSDPQLLAPQGIWALAERDFIAAADRFGRSWQRTGDRRSIGMALYALCVAGRVEEARRLLADLPADVRRAEVDAGFWAWMEQEFALE